MCSLSLPSLDDQEPQEPVSPNPFEQKIRSIDSNLSPIDRSKKLQPYLEGMGSLPAPEANALLLIIKEHFDLTADEYKDYKSEVSQQRKQFRKESKEMLAGGENRHFKANFPGLIDIVEDQGKPAFLVKEGDELSILPMEIRQDCVYIPPPMNQIEVPPV